MRSEEKSGLKHLEVSVCLDASNTFRVQPATRKRAEEIALDAARKNAKKLKALRWNVSVEALKKRVKKGQGAGLSPLSCEGENPLA